jgi:hypothetical protein
MRKSHNFGGDPVIVIKTEHCVALNHFAYALAHYCWNENIEFDPKMTKVKAVSILKDMLYQHGLNGETDFTMYESADNEVVAGFSNAYPLAMKWVIKNYPYLNKEVTNG